MTKKDFAKLISAKSGVGATETEMVLSSMGSAIGEVLAQGESVFLRGFGTFKVVERAEKKARNITKGTAIVIPAHCVPVLKFSEEVEGWVK